ncbi:MAG: DMT family transporter [Proteobacteria bacterium]|nr:DMT family transporter [Pseudomonadota bacterium]
MSAGGKWSIAGALAAAALFGASTPAAKALGADVNPFALAGLLYAGSGLGLGAWLLARRVAGRSVPLGIAAADLPWLAGAVLAGGVAAPAMLMFGLASTQATVASLLLNLESVFTALIAWFVFRENFDRRIAAGMALITAGGVLLAFEPGAFERFDGAALLVAAACLCWAIDNNLTRKISAGDAIAIAAIKGCVAGATNLALAVAAGAALPPVLVSAGAMGVGFAGYGLSLVLFVVALRELGAARTGAYFSTAPFVGVTLAIGVLGEPAGITFWGAAALMALGVWLHVSERHQHPHSHEPLEHAHRHSHDAHHAHSHDFDWDGSEPHTHPHRHQPLTHTHPHFPDIHHRHGH